MGERHRQIRALSHFPALRLDKAAGETPHTYGAPFWMRSAQKILVHPN
jgi:hypothetical protein